MESKRPLFSPFAPVEEAAVSVRPAEAACKGGPEMAN